MQEIYIYIYIQIFKKFWFCKSPSPFQLHSGPRLRRITWLLLILLSCNRFAQDASLVTVCVPSDAIVRCLRLSSSLGCLSKGCASEKLSSCCFFLVLDEKQTQNQVQGLSTSSILTGLDVLWSSFFILFFTKVLHWLVNTITRYHAVSLRMGCRLPLDCKEAAVVEHFRVMGVCSVRAEAMACGRFG